MATHSPYQIITNSKHRSILVVNDVYDVDRDPDIEFEDFDAIYIKVVDSVRDRIMLALRLVSPLLSEKCRFKPCFVTQRLKGWLGEAQILVDGYATDPLDANITLGIEEIYGYMRRCNFLLGTPPVVTHAEEIFRLCRYSISRGQYTFSSEPTPGVSEGFMKLYYYTLWNENQENMQIEERRYFMDQLIELGYVRRKRYIDRLHVCPKCNQSNLLFMECCPKCGSSNVRSEQVIHHFRCANIAPASAYESDGELVCPKCQHNLRHIGVDYDKPASIYTCQECKESFMYSDMKVICTNNRHQCSPDELKSLDVEEYEFTPPGIHAFASNDVLLSISQVGFYGYSSMPDFLMYLRTAVKEDSDNVLLIARYKVSEMAPDPWAPIFAPSPIVEAIKRLFNYKSALHGRDFYFMKKVPVGEVSESQAMMQYELNSEFADFSTLHSDFSYELVDEFVFHRGEDPDQFIQALTE